MKTGVLAGAAAVILIVCCTVLMMWPTPVDYTGGTALRYRVDATVRDEVTTVLDTRIRLFGVAHAQVIAVGRDGVTIRLTKEDAHHGDAIKELAGMTGKLELHRTVEREDTPRYDEYWEHFKGDRTHRELPVEALSEEDRQRYPHGMRWYPLTDRAIEAREVAKAAAAIAFGTDRRMPDGEPWVLCELDAYGITHVSFFDARASRYTRSTGPFVETWQIVFQVKALFHARMRELSTVERRLAIILDGVVETTPIVNTTITESAQITGGYTEQEARALAATLGGGALPAIPEFVDQHEIDGDSE